jgi:hypothetical protein
LAKLFIVSSELIERCISGISDNRWTTGAVYEPQVNLEDPPVGPQEEVDASPFEDENPEIIFSGLFSPQKGHTSFSPPSPILWNLSKTFSHFRHRYS